MDALPRTRSLRRLYSSSTTEQGISPLSPISQRPSSVVDAAAQAEWNAKEYVWCKDPTTGYVAAWIVKEYDEDSKTGERMADVMGVDDQLRNVNMMELERMNPPKFDKVEDIADLSFLNEASVVHNLRERYLDSLIYTYSGLFLVAVNPYRQIDIYSQPIVQAYKNRRRDECPPHVFAVAERAWQSMVGERECQSILVTGESGAGKTENTKRVIQYLTTIAAESAVTLPPSGSASSFQDIPVDVEHQKAERKKMSRLEEKILQANPILEAFGNAQTVRNNNSSRFGKFVRIEFTPSGSIAGACIDWYLLEKSRVTSRSNKERSFHVFYQLLTGANKELKKKLLLEGNAGDFEYLKSCPTTVQGVDEHEEWRTLQHALNVVGFKSSEQLDLFRVIAAILHLGDTPVSSSSDQAFVKDQTSLEKVCHLLGLPLPEFSKALLRPTVRAGREVITQARTKQQVLDEMAALCKSLYERCFGALVDRINQALVGEQIAETFIGVLDIAGFEIFEVNSFEQLCINYTNEKLQQFFNHHMFVLEQEEYAKEDIEWTYQNFGADLQPTIDLIESTTAPAIGILSCLDEECIMPSASDTTFTQKLHGIYTKSSVPQAAKYQPSKFTQGFTVTHYAGTVDYQTEGWLDKNKDPLNANVLSVLAASTEPFIRQLYSDVATSEVTTGKSAGVKRGAFRTVAQRHKEQLKSLMSQLSSTQPHFIRCIVPNADKRPGKISVPLVLDQLRCNGVLEGIRIARLGYPNRLPFTEFRQRYEILTPGVIPRGYMDSRKVCQKMLEHLELDKVETIGATSTSQTRIGRTKIFFKAGVLAALEEKRDSHLFDLFSRMQAACLRYVTRRRINKDLNRDAAIRTIQRNAKIYLELKNWPWWTLYTRIRPLLVATRSDQELKRKQKELEQVKATAEKELNEKLEVAKRTHNEQLARIQQDLEIENERLRTKDAVIGELNAEILRLQQDLTQADDHLDRALADQEASDQRNSSLSSAFAEATQALLELEKERSTWLEVQTSLNSQQSSLSEQLEGALASRSALSSQIESLKRSLLEKEEDTARVTKRLHLSISEAESKLASQNRERAEQQSKLDQANLALTQAKSNLNSARSDLESSLKAKESEVNLLSSKLDRLTRESDSATSQLATLQPRIDSLTRELNDHKAEAQRATSAKAQIEKELSDLKRLLEAKLSEESQKSELALLKEREIQQASQQLINRTKELAICKREAASTIDRLERELDRAKQDRAAFEERYQTLSKQTETSSMRIADLEKSLKRVENNRSVIVQELETARDKLHATDSQIQSLQESQRQANARAEQATSKLMGLEDQLVATQREHGTLSRQVQDLVAKLEEETLRRSQLSVARKTLEADIIALKERHACETAGLRRELLLSHEEIQAIRSSGTKTIVEHRHVLEEAKRYTDDRLSDKEAELMQLRKQLEAAEATRRRLQGENEDLIRQVEQERRTDRTADSEIRTLQTQLAKANKRLELEHQSLEQAERSISKLESDLAKSRTSQAHPSLSNSVSQAALNRRSVDFLAGQYDSNRIAELERKAAEGQAALAMVETLKAQLNRQEQRIKAATASTPATPASPSRRNLLQELAQNTQELEYEMNNKLSRMSPGPQQRTLPLQHSASKPELKHYRAESPSKPDPKHTRTESLKTFGGPDRSNTISSSISQSPSMNQSSRSWYV